MRALSVLMSSAVLALGCSGTPLGVADMAPDQLLVWLGADLGNDLPLGGCGNGVLDGNETDVDCGGLCVACAPGKMCKIASDCEGRICSNLTCAAPTCTDGVKNGNETDVDCGGDTCSGCADQKMCVDGKDCQGQVCVNTICTSSCTDGIKNGNESDVDCGGGLCPHCAVGRICLKGTDCVSGICSANVCHAKPRVLVVSSDPNGQTDVQQMLLGTGAFAAVDTADAPTVQTLQAHDAVLVWGSGGKIGANDITLSANLATYWDGGGRVVLALDASSDEFDGIGGFLDGRSGYIVMDAGTCCAGPDKLGVIDEPNSPLMAGVHAIVGNVLAQLGSPAFGAKAVAHWASGKTLVARGVVKGRNRVDLNLYPPSMYWQGDGATLLKNALLYE